MLRLGRELQVQLRHGPGGHGAGVAHLQAEAERPLAGRRLRRQVLEGAVGEAVAEGEGRLERGAPVAGLHALRVLDAQVVERRGGDRVRLAGRHHDRQAPGGSFIAEHNVGPSGARFLAAEEEREDRGDLVPPRHDHRARHLREHHRLGGVLGHLADEAVGAVVEVQVGAVGGLAARGRGHHDRDIRLHGRRDGGVHVVGRRLDHGDARRGGPALEAGQRADDVARDDVPAAAAGVVVALRPVALPLSQAVRVVRLRHGGAADHGDALRRAGPQGEQLVLVLQEDDGLRREAAREAGVAREPRAHVLLERALAGWRRAGLLARHDAHLVHGGEDAERGLVHDLRALRVLAEQLWRVPLPRLVGPGHLLVQAGAEARVVRRPPVRLHEAAEAQLLLEELEELLVRARVDAVHLVVGAHRGRDSGVDGGLEGRVVQLSGRLLVDDRVLQSAVLLLLVEGPVLDGGDATFGLDALHVGLREPAAQVRVLA
mmetsp:Transcript_15096/g.38815  ORF Transcript_15096/g.38815 Transcript_15096/m.38815 type:complete len:487 (+) Transcript_15096:474-1934(+)